jgi:hypothetical protein
VASHYASPVATSTKIWASDVGASIITSWPLSTSYVRHLPLRAARRLASDGFDDHGRHAKCVGTRSGSSFDHDAFNRERLRLGYRDV